MGDGGRGAGGTGAPPGELGDTREAQDESGRLATEATEAEAIEADEATDAIDADEEPTATMISGGAGAARSGAATSLRSGDHLGRYIIIEALGAGGVGEVYSAFDPQLARRVAVKVLRAKSLSKVGTARLQREAQAMARVKSDSVAAVYDVGEADGKPFVAMEYVDGVTLKAWMKASVRPWREILDIFKQAGRGLAAAHDRGIVHRDFKPGNVMVDSEGRARVLDFGLARVADELDPRSTGDALGVDGDSEAASAISASSLSLLTELTQAGRVMGTPKYMAPEQFVARGVDARSDQFSFCVVLYTALYREPPFAGRTPAELSRAVARGEVQDKPKRMGRAAWIRPILLRGLSKEQDDRYPSMPALLADLARDPVRRRRRAAAVVAVTALVAVSAALMVQRFDSSTATPCQAIESNLAGTWDADRRDAVRTSFLAAAKSRPARRDFAAETYGLVAERLGGYAANLGASRVDVCEATLVHGTQTADAMDLRMGCLDRKLREFTALTSVFSSALDLKAVQGAVSAVGSLPLISECDDLESLASVLPPPATEEVRKQVEDLRAELAVVRALDLVAQYEEGGKKALAVQTRATALGYRPLQAEATYEVGRSLERRGKYAEAKASLETAVLLADEVGHDEVRARSLSELIVVIGYWLHSFEQADQVALEARAVMARISATGDIMGPFHRHQGVVLFSAGKLQKSREHYEKALLAFKGAFGPNHPLVANTYNGLAAVYWGQGELPQALEHYQTAQRIWAASLGLEHPRVAMATHNIGLISMAKGNYGAAVTSLQSAYSTISATLGVDHPSVARVANNLGLALRAAGKNRASRPHYQRALRIWEEKLGDKHAWLVEPLVGLAWLDLRAGEPAKARAQLERALVICVAESCEKGDDEPVSHLYFGLAKVLWRGGSDGTDHADNARAIEFAQKAHAIFAASAANSAPAKAYLLELDAWLDERRLSPGATPAN